MSDDEFRRELERINREAVRDFWISGAVFFAIGAGASVQLGAFLS